MKDLVYAKKSQPTADATEKPKINMVSLMGITTAVVAGYNMLGTTDLKDIVDKLKNAVPHPLIAVLLIAGFTFMEVNHRDVE